MSAASWHGLFSGVVQVAGLTIRVWAEGSLRSLALSVILGNLCIANAGTQPMHADCRTASSGTVLAARSAIWQPFGQPVVSPDCANSYIFKLVVCVGLPIMFLSSSPHYK